MIDREQQQLLSEAGLSDDVISELSEEAGAEICRVISALTEQASINSENDLDEEGDKESGKVAAHVEKFSESFKGTSKKTLVAGFRAERKHNPGLTAREFLGGR